MDIVLCHHHFMETNIKKSFLRWNFLIPGFAPSQNLPNKTITAKQERKLSVKRKIIVKSRHKETQKASLNINKPEGKRDLSL